MENWRLFHWSTKNKSWPELFHWSVEDFLTVWMSSTSSGRLRSFQKSDVIISSIPTTPPWLLTRPAVNLTLHCSDKTTLPPKYSNIVFMNSVMSLRITIAYLTELLLLWSIETIQVCSITWYSKHIQSLIICHFACDKCGPTRKRKEFCNLFWFHVKSAIYLRL